VLAPAFCSKLAESGLDALMNVSGVSPSPPDGSETVYES
jgi:hypothetical protein